MSNLPQEEISPWIQDQIRKLSRSFWISKPPFHPAYTLKYFEIPLLWKISQRVLAVNSPGRDLSEYGSEETRGGSLRVILKSTSSSAPEGGAPGAISKRDGWFSTCRILLANGTSAASITVCLFPSPWPWNFCTATESACMHHLVSIATASDHQQSKRIQYHLFTMLLPRWGFLSLRCIDMTGWQFFIVGAVLPPVGCLAASLASTHQMPVAALNCDKLNYLHALLNVSWERRGSHLKNTELNHGNMGPNWILLF